MQRVLLVNMAPGQRSGARHVPLGMGYVAAELRASGRYEVRCLDYQLPQVTDEVVLAELSAGGYFAVGLKGFASDYLRLKSLTEKIKAQQGGGYPVVVGGPLATFSYVEVLKNTAADVCVLGEGEIIVTALLDNLDQPQNVDGVAYLDADGNVQCTYRATQKPKDIDEIAPPAYDLFPVEHYVDGREPLPRLIKYPKYRVIDLITGRGCPYKCKFCAKFSQKYRKRSVDSVIDEMRFLIKQYGINCFAMSDELFINFNFDWLEEFCSKVSGLKVAWRCQTRAHGLSLEPLKMLRRAGCVRMTLGVESGSPRILKAMNKKITVGDIEESIRLVQAAGIYPGIELIIGTPGECAETVAETVDLLQRLDLPPREMHFLQPYPGSDFFDEFLQGGFMKSHLQVLHDLSDPDVSLKKLVFNFTGLPDEDLIRLKQNAQRKMASNYLASLKRKNILKWLYHVVRKHLL